MSPTLDASSYVVVPVEEMEGRVNQVIKRRLRTERSARSGLVDDWTQQESDALADDLTHEIVAETAEAEGTNVGPLVRLVQSASQKISSQMPWRISTRDLSRHTTKLLGKLHDDERAAVVTYRGIPSFLVLPINQDDLLSLYLGSAPELREDHAAARAALDAGKGKYFS